VLPTEPAPTATEHTFNTELHSIDAATSLWVVVNKVRPLEPATHEPSPLIPLTALPGGSDQQLVLEAAAALVALYERLQADGLPLSVATAYRSYEYQSEIYQEYVAVWGRAHTETLVARPGYSEHQTGLAVDVFAASACRIKECFADEPTYAWLVDNAADFGFIERYPAGAQAVTGYQFEPWHWRYVGSELAQEMRSQGILTLEELFDLPPAPTYAE